MSLILDRNAVLDVLAEARDNGWVIPAFGVENLTTMEAVLAAAVAQGKILARADLPIMLAVTNNYPARRQTAHYTHTQDWKIGLGLFLAEAEVLMGEGTPYAGLRVMLHLDHALHDLDSELFAWDLRRFSSIMFDASTLPLEENIRVTRSFVDQHGETIVIEGACEQIGHGPAPLIDPALVDKFWRQSGVDLVVPNLGTEHRADASALSYESELARAIADRIGPRLVLHGTSSVKPEVLHSLAADGICKANVWTALERDSAPVLLEQMVCQAAKIAGQAHVQRLQAESLLGPGVASDSKPKMEFFPTSWRQNVIFQEMQRIASVYLRAWFPTKGK